MFVNRLSRLVVDPERFVDDSREELAAKGIGAVYTRTTEGMPLRGKELLSAQRVWLLNEYYFPYASAFQLLTSKMLDRFGRCLIIDGHSFPSKPLPYEFDQEPSRPDICIGTAWQRRLDPRTDGRPLLLSTMQRSLDSPDLRHYAGTSR